MMQYIFDMFFVLYYKVIVSRHKLRRGQSTSFNAAGSENTAFCASTQATLG